MRSISRKRPSRERGRSQFSSSPRPHNVTTTFQTPLPTGRKKNGGKRIKLFFFFLSSKADAGADPQRSSSSSSSSRICQTRKFCAQKGRVGWCTFRGIFFFRSLRPLVQRRVFIAMPPPSPPFSTSERENGQGLLQPMETYTFGFFPIPAPPPPPPSLLWQVSGVGIVEGRSTRSGGWMAITSFMQISRNLLLIP